MPPYEPTHAARPRLACIKTSPGLSDVALTIGIQDWPDARTDAWRNAVRNHRHYQVRILLHSQPADMLAEAQRKANERGVPVEWMHGDMRAFDLGGTFDFVFITANSLLHLHEAEDLVSCFRSVRRHMAPGARFVFDVFNPSVRLLAEADGLRRTRESLSFTDPDRGDVSVDMALPPFRGHGLCGFLRVRDLA